MFILLKLSKEENLAYYEKEEVELNLEEYLRGVVPSEIGNAAVQACAAQAICCRTYAINKIKSKGYLTDNAAIDQSFRASRLTGYSNAYKGIELTAGKYLAYSGKIAKCYYSSSNGGQTTSSEARWGTAYPYLISQRDTYDNGNGNGHGVGMSQIGAKNRAAAGHTYQQILSFYFPGTTIQGDENKMTIEQYILEWCKERVDKNAYIYGATQKNCTPSYRKTQATQYPDFKDNIYKYCRVLSGKSSSCSSACKWYDTAAKIGRPAYDCAQFVRWGAAAAGISGLKSGATSQWKSDVWDEKGEFANVPPNKLCCVFRDKNGTKEHVGWYYGDYAYHAQGHSSGVVRTDNTQYKSWTHYAILRGIYDKNGNPVEMTENEVIKVLYQAKVDSTDTKLNLRKSPSSSADKILQIPPQGIVDVIEETDSTWWKVVYANQTGYVMCKYLTKNLDSTAGNEYYVKIKCESEEDAKRIAKLLATATAE